MSSTLRAMPAPRIVVAAAVLAVFVGSIGDGVRYLVGGTAWTTIIVVSGVLWTVLLWRRRLDLTRVPRSLLFFHALAFVSCIWATSPLGTFVGSLAAFANLAAGLTISLLPFLRMMRVIHGTLQAILAGSLLFELAVALSGRPVYPVGHHHTPGEPAALAWSRGLLLHGGRIQGLPGNANLLSMVALLALVIAVCRAIDRPCGWTFLAVANAGACLVLSRSATVLAAMAGVGLAGLIWTVYRFRSRRAFGRVVATTVVGAVAGAAVLATWWTPILRFFGRDPSLTGRVDLWRAVLDWWSGSPLLGRGWMGYWQPWVAPYGHLFERKGVVYLQAHDVWLDVLMQLGVVGLLTWAAIQYAGFKSTLRWADGNRALRVAPFLILCALFGQGLAESRPLYQIGYYLMVAFTCGLGRRNTVLGRSTIT